MGLKSKLNKMKSFLFDEEDEEKEYKKPQKRRINIDNKNNDKEEFSKTAEIEELSFDETEDSNYEITNEIKSRSLKKDTDFKFPEFDDEDFIVSKTKPEIVIEPVKEEPKRVLYQGSKRKEEIKKFRPSPIISPIYGLLDMDGNVKKKDDKISDYKSVKDEVSIDDIRKKAYGSFDEELENTIKRLSKKTIEEAEKDMEREEKELSDTNVSINEVSIISSDEDDMILPNVDFKEIDVDKEKNKNIDKTLSSKMDIAVDEEDEEDTKEQDLFNLIDSMYQKEGNED